MGKGSKFKQVFESDFDSLLKSDKGWNKDSTGNEVVYLFPLTNSTGGAVTIKVFSSVRLSDSKGRGVGEDAIRVCAVVDADGKTRGLVKTSRIYRTGVWQDRVVGKVLEVIKLAQSRYAKYYA